MSGSLTPAEVQRTRSLRKANEIRLQRAQLKRDLKAGKVAFDKVLFTPPDWLEGASIGEMLRALPGIGKGKVSTALAVTHLSWTRTFGGTPLAQRHRLHSYMLDHHPRRYPIRS